jgi:VWFA-related protein
VSPSADAYLSGPVLLKVVREGEGSGSAVVDVTFFADGRQVCVVPEAKMECAWDAGPTIAPHAFRAVATLKGGGRLVANVRTRALTVAESVSVDIVQVNVVVTEGGRFVKGLTRDAFRLQDDKEERPILGFDPAGAPLELVLALDVSSSMKEALPDVQEAARSFLKALGPNDHVSVVAFNDTMFTVAPREVDLATRLSALDRLSSWGGTALHDVIVRSVELLSRQAGRRALVVFSDGEDVSSQATFEDVARLVSDSDTTLFAVGLGRGARVDSLKAKLGALADASGGLALFAENSAKLSEPFAEIVADLSNQYTIGFEPRRDGRSHVLTVQVPGRNVRVRARRAYIAPSK